MLVFLDSLPQLVFLQDGIPETFDGDLGRGEEILDWITAEVHADEIEIISLDLLNKIIATGNSIAVLLSTSPNHGIDGVQQIHATCKNLDIPVVQIVGTAGPKKFGIETLPALVYIESHVPAVFEEDLDKTDHVVDWLMEQRTADTIEEVTEEILQTLIEEVDYVAVIFTGLLLQLPF